jgi:hypothetical protein
MRWRDDTTLPSRGQSLRPTGAGRQTGPLSGVTPNADMVTPAANSSRTPPSRPRASARNVAPASRPGLCQPRIPEDRKERSASAVRKRIGPALAIVDDESLDGLDCIACAVMPTAAGLTPVAVQNRITRSCAVSGVVVFMIRPSPQSARRSARRSDPNESRACCNWRHRESRSGRGIAPPHAGRGHGE